MTDSKHQNMDDIENINLDQNNLHSDDSNDMDNEQHDDNECFLYNTDIPPTKIEKIFGEKYHVDDKYPSHQITIPFVITLFCIYFVEGCIDWMMIAIRYYGTSIWNIGPSEFSNFRSIVTIPWTIKIIYGLTIDSIPLLGYKRKSYMFIFGILAPLSMLIIIIFAKLYYIQMIFMILNALSVSFCDVIADALTVERTEFKSHTVAARLQGLAWSSRYISAIIGTLVSTRIEISGKPDDMLIVYWIYFGMSLSIIICSIILPEKKINQKQKQNELIDNINLSNINNDDDIINNNSIIDHPSYSIKQIIYITFRTLCRRSIFYPLLFTFILRSTPTTDEALSYYLIYKLGFSSIYIGYLSVAGGFAFLISIAIITYQSRKSNYNFSLRKLYLSWTLIAAFLPFITLILVFGINKKIGIPNFYFMLSDKVVVMVALDMLQMAINVLYARICPPGIEGVFMTVLTSVSNIGLIISYQNASWLISILNIKCIEDPDDEDSVICNFKYLWLFIIIVNLSTLIPLILIKKVPDEKQLKIIGETLKNINENDDTLIITDKSEMIKIYWIWIDYIYPFIKNKICCCICKKNTNNLSNGSKQLANVKKEKQHSHYAEIEMK